MKHSAAFEEWLSTPDGECARMDLAVAYAWDAWQAACEACAKAVEPIEGIEFTGEACADACRELAR